MAAGAGHSSAGSLDPLVAKVLAEYPYRFTLPATPAERAIGYRIRFEAACERGWVPPPDSDGLERDRFDDAFELGHTSNALVDS